MSLKRPFRMRPMYDVLLRGSERLPVGLYHLYQATPEQLCRLHYSQGSIKAVKGRLKVLTSHGYVQINPYAVKHSNGRTFYSARYAYTLTPLALRYLTGLGIDTSETWPSHQAEDKHGLFISHALELNDVIIAAAQLHRADPRFYLHDFRHERQLKRQPFKVTLEGGRESVVIPDAQLEFRKVGSNAHFPVLLEHDRGTEEQANFKRKVRAYVVFVRERLFITVLDSDRVNIAFTTFNGDERLAKIRAWTKQVLAERNEPPEVCVAFRFASLPRPLYPGTAWLEPRWLYAHDDQPPQPLIAA